MATSLKKWISFILSGALLTVGPAWGEANDANLIGPEQQQALERLATAESMIARDEAVLGRKFDPQYRLAVKQALSALSPAELRAIPEGISPSALGDAAADLVFTPVTPCRIIDTRLVGGPIPGNTSRNFLATGSGFSGQGGVGGSCGIPFGPATAVMINFVAVGPAGAGDLRAFPFPLAAPLASILNYTAVPGLAIANGVAVPVCNPAVSPCASDLTIQADVSATDVVADVVGYFAAPTPVPNLWAVVNADGSLARGFHAMSSSFDGNGAYTVTFDRNVRNCAYVASIGLSGASGFSDPGEITVVGALSTVNGVFLKISDSGNTAFVQRGFHLHVMC